MERRAFIGATAVAALSGCLGYDVQRTEQVERREQRISDLRSEVERLESELGAASAENEDLDSQNQQLEQDLETAKVEHLVSLYEEGDRAHRFGNGAMSSGRDSFETGDDELATHQLGQAYANYETSTDIFESADDLRREYGLSDDGIIGEAADKASVLADAAFSLSMAAYFYSIDDPETGETHVDEFNSINNDFSRYEIADPEELRSVLSA